VSDVAGAPAAPEKLFDATLTRLAIVVVLGTIMSVLDTTIVNVALNVLARDFKASVDQIQWVSTAYLLALAMVIPLSGWSIERFGAKPVWMTSLTLFLVGSVLCGLSWNIESLIAFRFLQGLGGGLILPVGQTILARQAGPQRMGRVLSVIGVPTLLGPILGPVIGGLIVTHFSWRWIFYVNVPIGVIALLCSVRFLPRGGRLEQPGRLDTLGVALLSPGLALLVYGLSQMGGSAGLTGTPVLVGVGLGLLFIAGFVLHALRVPDPLLDVRLFSHRGFAIANGTTFALGAALFGAMFLLPLYYQTVRGQTPLMAGLLMAPQGIGAACMMPVAGRISDRAGPRTVVPLGMVLVIVGTLPFCFVTPHTSEALLGFTLFIRGIGLGLAMMPTIAAAYQAVEHAAIPRATTMINIVRQVGGSVGIAILAVVLQVQIEAHFPGSSGSLSTVSGGPIPPVAAQGLAEAFARSFWWAIGISVAGLVVTLFLPKNPAAARSGHGPAPVTSVPAPLPEL